MSDGLISFEALLHLVERLPRPKSDDEREVQWVEANHVLGLSRQESGAIEIFLCGEEIRTTSPLIKRHLRFDTWMGGRDEAFLANRLILPCADHYTPTAAFLAEELLRRDVAVSVVAGFARTEPLIEMVLRRTGLTEDETLGLLGELRFLEALLIVAPGQRAKGKAIAAWKGHEKGARDFIDGRCGVEVKTTRSEHSRHRISNVMQVDPRRSLSGELQEELFLLSFGFRRVDRTNESSGFSLPELVDSILTRLESEVEENVSAELQGSFLEKVARYGSGASGGYVHQEMKHWSAYQDRWQHSFVRIYDMADSAILVLRREMIKHCNHVVLESVGFDIDLPDIVSGDLNPQSDLFLLAEKLLSIESRGDSYIR